MQSDAAANPGRVGGKFVRVASDGTGKVVRAGDGSPRPLDDEELEAVAGGGTWIISFSCCEDQFQASGATFEAALALATSAHNQQNATHGASSSYTAS